MSRHPPVLALTIAQPVASLVLAGRVPWIDRPRQAPAAVVGQRIMIHAGARVEQRWLREDHLRDRAAKALGPEWARHLPCSGILGSAILTRCKRAPAPGYYSWEFDAPETLRTPCPAHGRIGLWPWTPPAGVELPEGMASADLVSPPAPPQSAGLIDPRQPTDAQRELLARVCAVDGGIYAHSAGHWLTGDGRLLKLGRRKANRTDLAAMTARGWLEPLTGSGTPWNGAYRSRPDRYRITPAGAALARGEAQPTGDPSPATEAAIAALQTRRARR